MEISENKVVELHYKGTLSDGTVFDTSEGREPLLFIFGSGMIIPGLEEGIKGLKVGDKKKIDITSDKAYGKRDDRAVQKVPKSQMPEGAEIQIGMQLMAQGPQGAIPVTVTEVSETEITVDFNHPLADKDLTFEVEIVNVRDATKEELEHGHTHGADGAEAHGEADSEKDSENK